MISDRLRIGAMAPEWNHNALRNNSVSVNKAEKTTPEINDEGEIREEQEISGERSVHGHCWFEKRSRYSFPATGKDNGSAQF